MHSETIQHILTVLSSGQFCHLSGPTYYGKSAFIRSVRDDLEEHSNFLTYYVSMYDLPSGVFFDGRQFSEQLLERIQTGASLYFQTEWDLKQGLLAVARQSSRRLIIFLDDIDVLPDNRQRELFMAITDVNQELADSSGEILLQVVTCTSKPLHGIPEIERYKQFAQNIVIGELSLAETHDYIENCCRESDNHLPGESRAILLQEIGGDPRLLDTFFKLAEAELKAGTPVTPDDLRVLLGRLAKDAFVKSRLQAYETYIDAIDIIDFVLKHGAITHLSEVQREAISFMGIFRQGDDGLYRLKSAFWHDVLMAYLTDERLGRLYALNKRWIPAILRLGAALYTSANREQFTELRFTILTTTLLAMQDAEDEQAALKYLGDGLRVIYQNNLIDIYRLMPPEGLDLIFTNRRELVVVSDEVSNVKALISHAIHRLNYAIFRDTEQVGITIAMADGHYAIIVFDNVNQSHNAINEHEFSQLAMFLEQSAAILREKSTLNQMLKHSREDALRLDAIKEVLDTITHYRHKPTRTLYKLFLAGVTAHWGLSFDRAALFIYDSHRDALVCLHAVGNLSFQVAKQEWQNFPHSSFKMLLQYLLDDRDQPSPWMDKLSHIALSPENLMLTRLQDHPLVLTRDEIDAETAQAFDQAFEPLRGGDSFVLLRVSAPDGTPGILYVDDCFSSRAINDRQLDLLVDFSRRAFNLIYAAQSLELPQQDMYLQKRADDAMLKLKEVETLEDLEQKIVESAFAIFPDAYCAILYTFTNSPGDKEDSPAYVTENIISLPLSIIRETQPIRANEGIAAWVINSPEGYRVVPDIRKQPQIIMAKARYTLSANRFIQRHRLTAFVGVRLGSQEQPSGLLYVDWQSPRTLHEGEEAVLKEFMNLATNLIQEVRDRESNRLSGDAINIEQLLSSLSSGEEHIDLNSQIGWMLGQISDTQGMDHIRLILRDTDIQANEARWIEYRLTDAMQMESKVLTAHAPDERERLARYKQFFRNLQSNPERDDFNPKTIRLQGHPVAVAVRVEQNCVGLLYSEINFEQMPSVHRMAYEGAIIRRKNILMRYARSFSIVLRQHDITRALVNLRELSTHLGRSNEAREIAEVAVRQTVGSLRALDSMTLYFRDHDTGQVHIGSHFGIKNQENLVVFPPMGDDAILTLMQKGEEIFADKSLISSEFCRQEKFETSAAFPMKAERIPEIPEGIGIIFINYRFPHHFGEEEKNILRLFAETATIALNRAMTIRVIQQERHNLAVMEKLSLAIKSLKPDGVIEEILKVIKQEFGHIADNFALVELDRNTQQLRISPVNLKYYRAVSSPVEGGALVVDAHEKRGLAGVAIRDNHLIYETNIRSNPPSDYLPQIPTTDSQVCVPVSESAALVLESSTSAPFTREHLLLLIRIAAYVDIALQKAHAFEEMEQVKEQNWRQEIAILATGLLHDIHPIISIIPVAVKQIKAKLNEENLALIEPNLGKISEAMKKTRKISGLLQEFLKSKQFNRAETTLEDIFKRTQVLVGEQKSDDYDDVEIVFVAKHKNRVLFVDATWISLVLKNLIDNAARSINKSGVHTGKIVIYASVPQTDHRSIMEIRVKDNGAGIPKYMIEKVFHPGYTDSKDSETMLHGVGLYYCRQVAVAHGGYLRVEEKKSNKSKGATLCLELPIDARKYSLTKPHQTEAYNS